ncbi:MAG: polysulfide reductase NrfD [Fimbriimonas sp.]|nr:polysulfide reductase NrfD [Fimbriimonas sp.]
MNPIFANPMNLLAQGTGYVFPNERGELQWSILIVLYPYITGLVAGAFILASLVRVFKAEAVRPTYRLALLTALAFLICAPLPLVAHLGHPERAIQIMMTPHLTSAMAIFGFVYAWYLMAVLLLEVYFDYRKDMVLAAEKSGPIMKVFFTVCTLGVKDLSHKALEFDEKAGRFLTVIGIPSAVLLHGYVGFIFGSLKGNPWWSSVLMPLIFLLSAIVSGIAMVFLIYMISTWYRRQKIDMRCANAIGRYLMFALIFDLTLEALDIVHRMYEAGEWFDVLHLVSSGYMYYTLFIVQLFLGGIVPLVALAVLQAAKVSDVVKTRYYLVMSTLVLIGVFAMRWNVVIGGQLFSKTLRGLTTYRLQMVGHEGLIAFMIILLLPFFILWFLTAILPPWDKPDQEPALT